MKCAFILFCTVVFGVVSTADLYTDKYDNVDLDSILNNSRLYEKYFICLTSKGKCTSDGKYLKEALPGALATSCSKCTEKQKVGTKKVLKFLIENKPEDFAVLEKIYDPEGVYKTKYNEEAKKDGVKV